MSDLIVWRTVRLDWTGYGAPDGEHWRHGESVEIRYRPHDLGSIARSTKALEDAFRSAILSPAPFSVIVTDDIVEAP